MAGLPAFGYEYEITSWRPWDFLDYREETGDARRWEDRVVSQSGDWSGNVVDFYFMIIERLKRRFKMPFSTDSTGVRHGSRNPITEAVNEAVANALVHAYYGNDACVRVLVGETASVSATLETCWLIGTWQLRVVFLIRETQRHANHELYRGDGIGPGAA